MLEKRLVPFLEWMAEGKDLLKGFAEIHTQLKLKFSTLL